ncbi:MAG: hypothetical protein HC905_28355, partial [Bacteroidales bacterium]|nr:hypothetical protein [Bacteroidales bacterium]
GTIKFMWFVTGWVLKILVDWLNASLVMGRESSIFGYNRYKYFSDDYCFVVYYHCFDKDYISNRKPVYLILILGLSSVCLTEVLIRRISNITKSETIVYNAPSGVLMNFRQGKQSFVISDIPHERAERIIRPYNDHTGVGKTKFIDLSTPSWHQQNCLLYRQFVKFGKMTFYIWTEKPDFSIKPVEVDVLVIHNIKKSEIPLIRKYFNPKEIIVTSAVKRYQIMLLEEEFFATNYPITILSSHGYWAIENSKKYPK